MTEAMRKWADEKAGKKWPPPHIDEQAEYWARAVFKDIWARANEYRKYCCHSTVTSPPCDHCLARACEDINRELSV